jgi:hypothetical protein
MAAQNWAKLEKRADVTSIPLYCCGASMNLYRLFTGLRWSLIVAEGSTRPAAADLHEDVPRSLCQQSSVVCRSHSVK